MEIRALYVVSGRKIPVYSKILFILVENPTSFVHQVIIVIISRRSFASVLGFR